MFFGISPLLVCREMTLEEAQISDTHSLKYSQKAVFDNAEAKPKNFPNNVLSG
jgi:hypothetical protein